MTIALCLRGFDIADFDHVIVTKLRSVLDDYFRGLYRSAFDRADELAREGEQLDQEPLAGYQAQLYAVLALHMRRPTGRDVGLAEEEAMRLSDRAENDPSLSHRERAFFRLWGHMLAGWAMTSRKGRQRLAAAVGSLDKAARIQAAAAKTGYLIPSAWMIYHFRGWAHYQLGEIERAIQDLNRGVLLANEEIADRQRRSVLRGDWAAIRNFVRGEMPSLSRLLATRAIFFYEIGDFPAALEDIDLAIEVDEENPYVQGLAGVIHFAVSGARTRPMVFGEVDHHAIALRSLLKARDRYAEELGASGRAGHYLNLFSYQCRADTSTAKSLGPEARAILAEVPENDELTDEVFEKFLATERVLEAVSCLLVGLHPLETCDKTDQQGDFGRRIMFLMLSTIDGFYDYLGSLAISEVRFLGSLTKDVDQ